jgi:hypothetical protein
MITIPNRDVTGRLRARNAAIGKQQARFGVR